MHDDAPQLHALSNCGTFELLAAALTTPIKDDVLHSGSNVAFVNGIGILLQELALPRAQQREHCIAGPPSLSASEVSVLNPVLRI